jgi:FlaA1/EpsC-like NDP-sugar epimerase
MTADCAVNLVLDAAQDTHGGEVFIPKLRAANIADLAIALSGRRLGEWVAVGLRPGGEKLHEVLLSPEEAGRTFEAPSYYLLLPATHPWASAPPPFAKQRVAPAFVYSSETAPRIGVDELRALLAKVET